MLTGQSVPHSERGGQPEGLGGVGLGGVVREAGGGGKEVQPEAVQPVP